MLVAEYDGDPKLAAEFTENELSDENTCADTIDSDLRCPECRERVSHRDRSTDGRVPHFFHCPDMGQGGCGVSVEHDTLVRSVAASEVKDKLPELDVTETVAEAEELPAPCSDKQYRRPDVLMKFGDEDPQFGDGLIIEVQWQNKQKDIPMVTADYLNGDSDYAVLWLDGRDDFETEPESNPEEWSLTLTGSEIRKRVAEAIWPPANPASVWNNVRYDDTWTLDDRIPGKLDKLTHTVISHPAGTPSTDEYIADVRDTTTSNTATPITARFTTDMVDEIAQRAKRRYDWNALFQPPSTDEYIADVRDATTSNAVVPVTLPPQAAHEAIKAREKPSHLEYVQNEDVVHMWHHLFIYGWRQSTDRTPYENLKDAVSIDTPGEFSRETIKSFAFAFIRGLGPKVAERGLNRMDNEGNELPMMEAMDD
jgi:hypothetical protein